MTRTPGAGLLNVGYLVDNDISEQGRRQRDTCGRLTRFGGATQTRTEDLSISVSFRELSPAGPMARNRC